MSATPLPSAAAGSEPASGWRAVAPNAITSARLVMTAGVVVALSAGSGPETLVIAAALFVVAAASDAVDGWLARRWNAVSRFGRIADPLTDKLLVLSAFVMMAGPALSARTGVAPWMAAVLLARELLVTTIRAEREAGGIDASALWAGKAKMVVQSLTVPLVLALAAARPHADAPALARAAVWTTVAVTVLSAAPYVRAATRPARSDR